MITKKTEYAIRALWELANSHTETGHITANQIAQRQVIPPKYLPQIVSELTRSGLVNSSRGFGGGLRLARDARDISLLEIIEAVQGHMTLFECQITEVDCGHMPNCDLRQLYNRAQRALEEEFRTTQLADLKLGEAAPVKQR